MPFKEIALRHGAASIVHVKYSFAKQRNSLIACELEALCRVLDTL